MQSISKSLFLFSLSLLISGCVPVIIGGGAIGGSCLAIRDKKIGESLSDTKLETVIKARLYKISPELYSAVSVSVDQGNVLLTGAVTNPEWINIAEKEAWSVNGVSVVDNNITTDEISVPQIMQDSMITSSCRVSLICSKDIRSVNYKLKTMNCVVYVTGIARSRTELDLVLTTIQKIKNVKKVVSYVNIIK